MSNDSSKGSFFEPRTLLAIVLVGIVWMGWQRYMEQKYPNLNQTAKDQDNNTVGTETVSQTNPLGSANLQTSGFGVSGAAQPSGETNSFTEEFISFDDSNLHFELSSRGMSLRNLVLKNYKDRSFNPIEFNTSTRHRLFETVTGNSNKPIEFRIERVSENEFLGTAILESGEKIKKKLRIFSETYSLEINIEGEGFKQGENLKMLMTGKVEPIPETSFLMPATDFQEAFASYKATSSRKVLNDIAKFDLEAFPEASLVSIGSHYFAIALVNKSEIIPDAQVGLDEEKQNILAEMKFPVLNTSNKLNLDLIGYIGPKSIDTLKKVESRLPAIIDFGWFDFIAIPMLALLKWFFTIFKNYGIAVILLTVVVRIFVLPFAITSYRSMKAMQAIQPQMKILREKYQKDPQTLNKEMMVLMKENKANPLSSCLPMLLQFPVFIALYRVLGSSIELYQTPFFFWIKDLSLKDPYYILPVLMGVTMFIQQKITPTQMDPVQQKVFLILPVFMSFIMASLPSGLTLYIFVSTLFGIFQQLFFMREREPQGDRVGIGAGS